MHQETLSYLGRSCDLNLENMKTIGKSQFVIDPKKKSQTLKKKPNKQSMAHTYMCLEERLGIFIFFGG
jgi:hypothetical protein